MVGWTTLAGLMHNSYGLLATLNGLMDHKPGHVVFLVVLVAMTKAYVT